MFRQCEFACGRAYSARVVMRAELYSQSAASRTRTPVERVLPRCSSLAYNNDFAVISHKLAAPIRPERRRLHEIPPSEVRRSFPHHLLRTFPVGGRRDSENRLEARHWRAARQPGHPQAPTERFDRRRLLARRAGRRFWLRNLLT